MRPDGSQVRPVVVLAGPPGSGKSAVAEALSARLAVSWRDVDHDVEAVAGRTVPEIFAGEGEPAFRTRETAALDAALRTHEGVLSLGGGTPVAPRNQELLAGYVRAGGSVVLLDVDPDVAVARMGDTHGRPLLGDDPRARFLALVREREGAYAAVSTLRVDTSTRSVDEVVDVVVGHLTTLSNDLTRRTTTHHDL